MIQQQDLAGKTLRGVFWSSLSLVGGKGLTFISTMVLARLLLPEQFGIMGYCLVIIQYFDVLNTSGIGIALISRRERVEEAANAAFVANIILGITTFALAWLIAPFAAEFFSENQIIPLLRILALTLPVNALGMVPDAIIQRKFRFGTRLISELGRNFVKAAVSIFLAYSGFGVWSLVIGQLFSVLVGVTLNWLMAGWKPTWRFHSETNRAMMLFGINILILDIANVFGSNVDYLLVGRILGATALGYYTMSYRIPQLIIYSLNNAVGTASFPALASVQNDEKRLKHYYFNYIRYLSLFVLPIGVGLALTAPTFITVLLSDSWIPAILPTALISLALAILSMGYVPGVLYKAIGRPEILNYLVLVKAPIVVSVLWFSTRWGIAGVAAGQVASACILVTIDTLCANYIMKYRVLDLLKAIFPSAIASLIMGGLLILLYRLFSLDGVFGLISVVIAGAGCYFAALVLISRETIIQGLTILKRSFRGWQPGFNGKA